MNKFNTAEEILDFAINSEQEAHDFYISVSKLVNSKEIQNLLISFAEEELGHKKKLMSIKNTKQYGFSDKHILNLKMADYFVDIEPEENLSYQKALIIAMKKEKAAFKLYSDLAELVPDKLLKTIFLSLAQEEAKHKLRFEIEYDTYILKDN